MIQDFTKVLSSQHSLIELGILVSAAILSWLLASLIRRLLPDNLKPGIAKIGAGGAQRIIWPLFLLAIIWGARMALVKFQPAPILSIVIPLIAAFAVIRLVVYLLRHMMAPSALLKASERFLVLTIWALFALHMTGTLTDITAALDDISFFTSGKQKVSLLLVIQAVLSAAVTIFLALGLSSLIETRIMKAEAVDMSSRVVITKFIRAMALVVAVLIAMPLVGVDLKLLSVFGGALGVGLGFGLQKIASNYVSGFIILLDRSIRLGDLVTVDNKYGVVNAIKARYTVIKSLDGTEAIVPNDTLITNTVVNHSYTDTRVSMKIVLTICYGSDLQAAKDILAAAAQTEPRVLKEPAPTVLVRALTDRGIELELQVWISDAENGQSILRSELLTKILAEFVIANLEIATVPSAELKSKAGLLPIA